MFVLQACMIGSILHLYFSYIVVIIITLCFTVGITCHNEDDLKCSYYSQSCISFNSNKSCLLDHFTGKIHFTRNTEPLCRKVSLHWKSHLSFESTSEENATTGAPKLINSDLFLEKRATVPTKTDTAARFFRNKSLLISFGAPVMQLHGEISLRLK